MKKIWKRDKTITVNGVSYETSITVTRRIEWNTDKWFIQYMVNGVWYPTYIRYAGYPMRHHHWYIPSINECFISGSMGVDRVIDKLQKYADSPVAIIPSGSLYTPVTLKVQNAIAIPTRLQRMQWILDTLRQQSDLCAVHDLNTSIRIECKDSDKTRVERIIGHMTDGISIVWKLYTVNTFTGQIAQVAEEAA